MAAVDDKDQSWTFVTRKQDVDIYSKKYEGASISATKGIAKINYPADVVFSVFIDAALKPKWDSAFDYGKRVRIIFIIL